MFDNTPSSGDNGNALLTLDETMPPRRVSQSTMYRLIEREELPGWKVAKRWVFDRKDLDDFIARKRAASHRR
jgi:excisionase family DNA binding protein